MHTSRFVLVACVSFGLAACGAESEPESSPRSSTEAETAQTEPSDTTAEGPPPEIERPYEEGVDAQAQIDAAVTSSREDGKRVLLVFGANWCPWCRRLDWVFQNDPRITAALSEGYHLVHVDAGARGSDTNRQVALRYGDPLSNGLPCLVVLDDEGGVAHVQETGSLESGDRHDPARVLGFLGEWRDGNAG